MESFIMFEDIKKEPEEMEVYFNTWMEVDKVEEDPLAVTGTQVEDFHRTEALHDVVPTLTQAPFTSVLAANDIKSEHVFPTQDFHRTEVLHDVVPTLTQGLFPSVLAANNIKSEHVFPTQVLEKDDSCHLEREVHSGTLLPCRTCTLTFTSLSDMENHRPHCSGSNALEDSSSDDCVEIVSVENTAEERWNHCSRCEYKTKDIANYENHMRSHSALYSILNKSENCICTLCNVNFFTVDSLRKHNATHIDVGCRLCDCKFSSSILITKHMLSSHVTATSAACKFCGFKSDINSVLMMHLMKVHTVQKCCIVCKIQFFGETDLYCHMGRHIEKKTYTCNECQRKYCEMSYLTEHMKKHTTANSKPSIYNCDLCDFKSREEKKLMIHTRTHTGEKPFKCDQCDFKTATESTLRHHLLVHTGAKPFGCKLCDYRGNRKDKLNIHMRIHTGENPYQCGVCDHKFRSSNLLIRHKATHSKEKILLCEFCGRLFKDRKQFTIHKRIHSGEKPYICDSCDYKGKSKISLKEHIRLHTNEKPFKCKLCAYKTSRNGNLVKHNWIHSGYKPYACVVCDFKCSNPSNYVKHKKMHERKAIDSLSV